MIEKIVISANAEVDLARPHRWYTDNARDGTAERYLQSFHSTLELLRTFPGAGRRRRFRATELAGICSLAVRRPFGVNLVFYRFDSKVLSVERVMHGARDLPRRLMERPQYL